jgi:hypothetical protein
MMIVVDNDNKNCDNDDDRVDVDDRINVDDRIDVNDRSSNDDNVHVNDSNLNGKVVLEHQNDYLRLSTILEDPRILEVVEHQSPSQIPSLMMI